MNVVSQAWTITRFDN